MATDKIEAAVYRFRDMTEEYLNAREVSAVKGLLATVKVGGSIDLGGIEVPVSNLEKAVEDRGGFDANKELPEKPSTNQRDLISMLADGGLLPDDVETVAKEALENYAKIPQRGRAAGSNQ